MFYRFLRCINKPHFTIFLVLISSVGVQSSCLSCSFTIVCESVKVQVFFNLKNKKGLKSSNIPPLVMHTISFFPIQFSTASNFPLAVALKY